jgi:hypothetical protein
MIVRADVSAWVPESIKGMVEQISIGDEIARRLLTADQMKTVWETLRSKKIKVATSAIDPAQSSSLRSDLFPGIDAWEISVTMGLKEQACVAFLCSVTVELWRAAEAVRQQDLAIMVKRWRDAAQMCRIAMEEPGRALLEPDLSKSLSASSLYLEECASLIEQSNKNSPYVIELERDRGGDDNVRARTRALASHARAIFGQYLYNTTATVASVGLSAEVTPGKVREWCKDEPC